PAPELRILGDLADLRLQRRQALYFLLQLDVGLAERGVVGAQDTRSLAGRRDQFGELLQRLGRFVSLARDGAEGETGNIHWQCLRLGPGFRGQAARRGRSINDSRPPIYGWES